MKKTTLLGSLLLLTTSLSWSQQNNEAMEVTYQLTTTTSYNVSEEAKENMSLYNQIKFMPMVTKDDFSEIIYDDGSTEKTIQHSFPNGMPEEWLVKPTQTEITKDSVLVYVENNVYSRFALQEHELVAAKDAGPYYLATPLWKLPLKEEEINQLELEGVQIKCNDGISLQYTFNEMTFYYNAQLMIEETSVSDGEQDIEKHTTAYQRDAKGHLVLDYQVERYLAYDSSMNDYVETVYTYDYENIIRNFLDPTLEPPVEYPENGIISCISASQHVGTQEVHVKFEETCPEGDYLIRVLDLQGNVRLENIQISKINSFFLAHNLKFGIHVIEVMNQTVPSCTFMYLP